MYSTTEFLHFTALDIHQSHVHIWLSKLPPPHRGYPPTNQKLECNSDNLPNRNTVKQCTIIQISLHWLWYNDTAVNGRTLNTISKYKNGYFTDYTLLNTSQYKYMWTSNIYTYHVWCKGGRGALASPNTRRVPTEKTKKKVTAHRAVNTAQNQKYACQNKNKISPFL